MASSGFIKRWLRRFLALMVVLLCLIGLLALAAQTPPAKRALANMIAAFVTEHTDFTLTIEGLTGTLPHRFRVARVQLADGEGDLLSLREIEASLALAPLLRGRLHLHALTVEHIRLWRRPAPQERWRIPRLPELPAWPTIDQMRVSRIDLDEAVVGAQAAVTVSGWLRPVEAGLFPEVELDVRGLDDADIVVALQYGYENDAPHLALRVQDDALLPALLDTPPPVLLQVNGQGPRADWRAELMASTGGTTVAEGTLLMAEGDDTHLDAYLNLQVGAAPWLRDHVALLGDPIEARVSGALDRTGQLQLTAASVRSHTLNADIIGLIHFAQEHAALEFLFHYDDMNRLPGVAFDTTPVPLEAALFLEGDFDALKMTVNAMIDGEELIDGNVLLGLAEPVTGQGALRLTPTAVVRSAYPTVPDTEIAAHFDIAYEEETGVLHINHVEAVGAGLDVSMRGRLIPELPALDVNASLKAEDLAMLSVFLPVSMRGGAQVNVTAVGDGEGLAATVTGDTTAFEMDAVRIAQGNIEITAQWADWLSAAPTAIQLVSMASATGLHIAGMTPLDIGLNTTVEAPTLDDITLTAFSLSGDVITATGHGTMNAEDLTGNLQIEAVLPSLAALPFNVVGLPDGEATIQIAARGGITPLLLHASVAGDVREIVMPHDTAAAFIGDTLAFSFETVVSDSQIDVSAFSLTGAAFEAEGRGVYQLATNTVQAEAHATLPDLSIPGAAIDQPISGAITLTAEASGVLPNVTVSALLEAEEMTYATGPPLHARIQIAGAALPAHPEISVSGQAEGGGETLTLDIKTTFEEGRVVIAPISLRAGNNHITGEAGYAIETGAPEAHIEITLEDLGALAALAGYEMSGRGAGTLNLQRDAAEMAFTFHDLRYDAVTLEKTVSELRVENLWDAPQGVFSLELVSLQADAASLNTLRLDARGGGENIEVNISADGLLHTGVDALQQFTGEAAGRITISEQRLVLTRLDGMLGAFPFSLSSDAAAAITAEGLHLAPTGMRIGDGAIHAEGQMTPASLQGLVRFEALPLALASLATAPAATGRLDGSITLAGTPESPEGVVALQISEGGLAMEAAEGFAPLTATINARLINGQLDASLVAAMDGVADVSASGTVPLLLQLQPWAFELSPAAPLSGHAELDVRFNPMLQALGLVEHHLDAHLTGAFTLAGTLEAPRASGDAHIRDGRYENAVAGTRLERITLHILAEDSTLRITEFSAVTGSRGDITATGELRLAPDQKFPITANIAFKDAELAQLDYLSARVNGDLVVAGDLGSTLVSGDLIIVPVYASIPDQMPVGEPLVIEVIEIEDDAVVTPPEDDDAPLLPDVKLDIRCEFPARTYMRAPVLDSEWSGTLRVTGTIADPHVEGRITVLRGHLDFLGRRFMLRDSAINFLGGPPTAARLDMHATAQTPALLARLNLTGDLSEVKLELDSEPSLPQDEVLAQILFGRDLSRISPVQAIQLARIAAMFGRGMGGLQLLSGNIGLPGIGRLDIRTGERTDETVVGMGRYFTDSVYVEVEQGASSDSGKISVEVEVTPRISVKGDVDARERSGVGLFWGRDY